MRVAVVVLFGPWVASGFLTPSGPTQTLTLTHFHRGPAAICVGRKEGENWLQRIRFWQESSKGETPGVAAGKAEKETRFGHVELSAKLRASFRGGTGVSSLLSDYGSDALSEALKEIVPDEKMISRILGIATPKEEDHKQHSAAEMTEARAAPRSESEEELAAVVEEQQGPSLSSELAGCLELMNEGRFLDAHETLHGLYATDATANVLETVCALELGCVDDLDERFAHLEDYEHSSKVVSPILRRRRAEEEEAASAKKMKIAAEPVRDLALALKALRVDDDPSTAYAYALCAAGRPNLSPALAELAKKKIAEIDDILQQRGPFSPLAPVSAAEEEEAEAEAELFRSSPEEDAFYQDLKERVEDAPANSSLHAMLRLVGLAEVKEAFVQTREAVELEKEREEDPSRKQYSAIFTGNPGTGKSTVGRLYGTLLQELGIVPTEPDSYARVVETSGAKLVQMGVQEFQQKLLPNFNDDGKSDLSEGQAVRMRGKSYKGEGHISYVDERTGTWDVHWGDTVDYKVKRADIVDLSRVGGVLFVDDAWQLEPSKNSAGRQILDLLLSAMDQWQGRLVVIFAGAEDKLDAELFEDPRSAGLASRFRKRFHFPDFTDPELGLLLRKELQEKKPKFFFPEEDKYVRIAAKRLGRQRGTVGFGNARAVQHFIDTASDRQTARILKVRRQLKKMNKAQLASLEEEGEVSSLSLSSLSSLSSNAGALTTTTTSSPLHIFEITRDDFLGQRERLRETVEQSEAWRELHAMYGLTRVKESVDQLVTMVETNAEREELEMEPQHVSLNRVFLGNPGTGKTSVAKLYAQILKELGLLSKGDVIVKNPSDFVGSALGQSEERTAAILDKARGSVLVIDEAYGLHPSPGASKRGQIGDRADPYKSAVVDTIVARVQGLAGEDQCVLLLGYKAEMEDLVRNANPGLQRRFQLDHAFHFDDYDDDALFRILVGQVKKRGRTVSFDAAKTAVRRRLAKDRLRPHFGNAGAVANLVSDAVAKAEVRLQNAHAALNGGGGSSSLAQAALDTELRVEDFYVAPPHVEDPEKFVFEGLVGCDFVKQKFREYRAVVDAARNVGRDPLEDLPLTFAFVGSPGTGKTTIAKKMGVLFESLGVLPSSEVKVCSAADFSTGYVGQAARKTRDIFESARGAVLFVDEAYRLWDPHGRSYFQEATDEIVSMLTEDEFKGKMVVIFAGYSKPMREMLDNVNPGLKSRVSEIIDFPDFDAKSSAELAELMLQKRKRLQVSDEVKAALPTYTEKLVSTPNYANGRDVDNWVKRIASECARRDHPSVVDVEAVQVATDKMIEHMTGKKGGGKKKKKKKKQLAQDQDDEENDQDDGQPQDDDQILNSLKYTGPKKGGKKQPFKIPPPAFRRADATPPKPVEVAVETKEEYVAEEMEPPSKPKGGGGNLAGLLEEAVVALGYDETPEKRTSLKDALSLTGSLPEDILAYVKSKSELPHDELVAALQAQIPTLVIAIGAKLLYDNQRAVELAKLSGEARQNENDKEAQIQSKLREMGKCPAGFTWHRQGAGWRCGGGTHYVRDDDPMLYAD